MGHLSTVASAPAPRLTSGPCRIVPRASHELMVKVVDEVMADAAPRQYCRRVTAMPSDATPHRISLPRTIRAIKQALTAEQRTQFMAELEDIEAGGLRATVEKWWLTAVLNLSGTWDRVEAVKAGTARTVPVEDVIPGFADLFERRHGRPYVGHASR